MVKTIYSNIVDFSAKNHMSFEETLMFLQEHHDNSLIVSLKLPILDGIKINNTPISVEDAIDAIRYASQVVKDIEVSYKGTSYQVLTYRSFDDKNFRTLMKALQWFIEN